MSKSGIRATNYTTSSQQKAALNMNLSWKKAVKSFNILPKEGKLKLYIVEQRLKISLHNSRFFKNRHLKQWNQTRCVALSCVSNYAGLISTSGREGFDSPTLVFLIYIFFSIFIPIASPPCPIVPATWHEHSFLDSHSARRRTALQLPAKTPYLCLAACRQDGVVRLRWGCREGWRG